VRSKKKEPVRGFTWGFFVGPRIHVNKRHQTESVNGLLQIVVAKTSDERSSGSEEGMILMGHVESARDLGNS